MKEKEFDECIKNILKKEVPEPKEYKNAIKNTFSGKRKTKKRFKLVPNVIAASMLVCLVTGLVYAKDIKKVVHNFFNGSEGVDTAIENNYIYVPEMNYIESSNAEIKVDNILMDDFNLSLTFSVKLDNEIDISKISRMRFAKMIITDEENRIIYCSDKETFDNHCEKNNLDYKYGDFNENYINNGSNWYIKSKSKEENTAEFICNFYANPYPKSKKLFVDLTQINMSEKEISENEETALTGNWKIDIDIPEEFYNREAILYKVKNSSDESIHVTQAAVYNTCMKFDFETQVKPIYEENDSAEVKKEKTDAFEEWGLSTIDTPFVNNCYVENEKGEKFYPDLGRFWRNSRSLWTFRRIFKL